MHRRKLLETALALCGGALVHSAATSASARPTTSRLFIIARSKNANIVRYDARLNVEGGLDLENPVVAYWILAAEDNRREGLSWLERRLAYGYELSDVNERGFRMRLSASGRRPLTIERDGARGFRARTQIAGRPAFLRKVFVSTDEGGVLPSVNYVELHGIDAARSSPLSERLAP